MCNTIHSVLLEILRRGMQHAFGGMVTRQVISPYPSDLAPRTTGSEERLKLIDLGGILVESLRMCSINWLNSGLSEWLNDQQMPNKSCKGESCQLEMAWSPCYFFDQPCHLSPCSSTNQWLLILIHKITLFTFHS